MALGRYAGDLLDSITQLAVAKVVLDQSRHAEDAGSSLGFSMADGLERGVGRTLALRVALCAGQEQERDCRPGAGEATN